MTDEKKHLVIERPRKPGSIPVWFAILDAESHWCDWKLVRCGVLNADGTCAHYGEACWPSEGCSDIEKAEPTLSGFIKWDGCMEFSAGHGTADDHQIHVCDGPASALEIFQAWNWLLTEAHQAMIAVGGSPDWEPLQLPEAS